MYEEHEHALVVRRPDSARLAIIFTGLSRRIWGLGPLEFLSKGGLERVSFILLWDTYSAGYTFGCGDHLPSLDALLAWIETRAATFTHASERFCIGVSGGTLAAMVTAEHLRTPCSIVFGPRHPPIALTSIVRQRGAPVRLSAADRLRTWLYERGELPARRLAGRRAREWVAPGIVRAALADAAPLIRRLDPRTRTQHHIYYVRSNMPDRTFVRHLHEHRVNLRAHPVHPPPGHRGRIAGWDHAVVRILVAKDALKPAIADALRASIADQPLAAAPAGLSHGTSPGTADRAASRRGVVE